MKNGKIIETGKPKNLYKNPNSKYVASLFGDVNTINSSYFNSNTNEELLLYAHQFKVVLHSKLKVKVKMSYFRGNAYLNEAIYEKDKILFFESKEDLTNQEVFLEIDK